MEEVQLYKDAACTQPIAPMGNITILKHTLVCDVDGTKVTNWDILDLDGTAGDEDPWEVLREAEGPILMPWLYRLYTTTSNEEYGYALGKWNPENGQCRFYVNVMNQESLQFVVIDMDTYNEDCYFNTLKCITVIV